MLLFELTLADEKDIDPFEKTALEAGFIDIALRSPPKEVKAPPIDENRAVPSTLYLE
jgi:hypothetical protein